MRKGGRGRWRACGDALTPGSRCCGWSVSGWDLCKHVSISHVALRVAGITWVLVYRTDKYKRLKAEVEKQSKKCEYSSFLSEVVSIKKKELISTKKKTKQKEGVSVGQVQEAPTCGGY